MASTVAAPGSYQQYKNDTAIFLTWISQAAQACGYVASMASQRSRASKQPSDSSTAADPSKVKVKEIAEQARCVVNSAAPYLRLPRNICQLAKRAINTRREFTARFLGLSSRSNSGDRAHDFADSNINKTHAYFTNTLQEALDALEEQ